MIRLFVGLELPADVRDRLAGLAMPLPGARWIAAENLHLTLRFIGEVDHDRAGEIDDALARLAAAPLEVAVDGVGHFASRNRVRALWAGIAPSPALDALQARTEALCQRAGLAPEGRRFTAHVTLARCRGLSADRAAPFIEAWAGFRAPPFTVDHAALFSSSLGRTGADYRVEASLSAERRHRRGYRCLGRGVTPQQTTLHAEAAQRVVDLWPVGGAEQAHMHQQRIEVVEIAAGFEETGRERPVLLVSREEG